MKKLIVVIVSLTLILATKKTYAQYSAKDFGAKGTGSILDTHAIQSAIDKASADGGGIVTISSGTYLIGTLILKDNVDLHLQPGATLLGSPNYKDYIEINQKFESRSKELYAKYFMLFAEGAKNISISGSGIINGNGLTNFTKVYPQNQRPFIVRLVDCENVIIRDVHLLNSANWTLHLLGCSDVNVEGVEIANEANSNRDGLDIDCCKRVRVSNSRFSTGDDAIVMKASSNVICQDIAISNCIVSSRATGIKTGTESNGGFRNITVSNCIIKDITVHSGIELITVDGGMMQNILFENIIMENVATPIFIRLGLRARPFKSGQYVQHIDNVSDISLNNISVTNAKLPSSIMGLHNKKIRNVSITNYTVRNSVVQEAVPYNKVPFEEFAYPMAIMYEHLPAYGLYCRNVEELYLQNVTMYSADNEARPALAFDRVNNIELQSVKAEMKNPGTVLAHFRNSKNITAGFCRTIGNSNSLFEVEENSIKNLNVFNSILQSDQKEIKKVTRLEDDQLFEDFNTALKYTVDKGEMTNGLTAKNLKNDPVKFKLEMTKKGSLQLCILILNDSAVPEKVLVKYEGITQEFTINWSEWGWAPITLLKEYPTNKSVDFEIVPLKENSNLKVARVYFRYQNTKITD